MSAKSARPLIGRKGITPNSWKGWSEGRSSFTTTDTTTFRDTTASSCSPRPTGHWLLDAQDGGYRLFLSSRARWAAFAARVLVAAPVVSGFGPAWS